MALKFAAILTCSVLHRFLLLPTTIQLQLESFVGTFIEEHSLDQLPGTGQLIMQQLFLLILERNKQPTCTWG